ncbi:MAG: alpha/beta fold hydrolase [Dehalococcoidia bacterium]
MEPRIQYAKTSDGVSIAFWATGQGKPMIRVPTGPWSLTVELTDPGTTAWYERLAQRYTAVVYDNRGVGLSGGAADWSFAAQIRGLDAVANHLTAGTFALVGPLFGGPAAIAYAAAHPERVSHLLLWCSWARTADALSSPQAQAILALMDKDWEVLTETLTRIILGWSTDASSSVAVAVRESLTPELMRSYLGAFLEMDTTDLLPRLQMPALVVHAKQALFPGLEVAQGLTSRIPNARLVLLEGTAAPWAGDMEANARAIEDFVGETGTTPALDVAPSENVASTVDAVIEPSHGMAVILFADIVDSTGLTEQMGDAVFRERARKLDDALRTAIRRSGGTPVEGKLLGDGVLAVFMSAQQAIEASWSCVGAGDAAGLRLHLGIHAGDVIREEDPDGRANVYGGTVNTAARIAAMSAPGEVLVSDTVRGLARTSAGVTFEDRGDHELKGISDAIHVFAVRRGTLETQRTGETVPALPSAGPELTAPDIQYVRTPDGVSIAFSTIGEGRPIIFLPQFPWSHIQKEWEMPAFRKFWSGAASTMRVIRYDARGTGLSDREVRDLSPEAQLRDLDALVQSLGLESFALVGAMTAGPMAIEYAGRHSDRVSHLLLWCTAATIRDVYQAGSDGLLSMAITNWHFFTQAIAHSTLSWLHADEAQQMAEFLRACVTPETLIASMPAFRALDATPFLSAVTARTLVMTRRNTPYLGLDVARGLASQIRGARLVVVEGSSLAPVGDEAAVVEVMSEFMREDGQEPAGRAVADQPVNLTARETEVLSLLAGGRTGKEIAAELTVSLSTVQRHIANVYAKIGVRGRVEAAAYALARGLVQPRSD